MSHEDGGFHSRSSSIIFCSTCNASFRDKESTIQTANQEWLPGTARMTPKDKWCSRKPKIRFLHGQNKHTEGCLLEHCQGMQEMFCWCWTWCATTAMQWSITSLGCCFSSRKDQDRWLCCIKKCVMLMWQMWTIWWETSWREWSLTRIIARQRMLAQTFACARNCGQCAWMLNRLAGFAVVCQWRRQRHLATRLTRHPRAALCFGFIVGGDCVLWPCSVVCPLSCFTLCLIQRVN